MGRHNVRNAMGQFQHGSIHSSERHTEWQHARRKAIRLLHSIMGPGRSLQGALRITKRMYINSSGKKKSILRKFLHHLRGSLQNMRMCMHDHRGWRWDNPCKRNIVTQLTGHVNGHERTVGHLSGSLDKMSKAIGHLEGAEEEESNEAQRAAIQDKEKQVAKALRSVSKHIEHVERVRTIQDRRQRYTQRLRRAKLDLGEGHDSLLEVSTTSKAVAAENKAEDKPAAMVEELKQDSTQEKTAGDWAEGKGQ